MDSFIEVSSHSALANCQTPATISQPGTAAGNQAGEKDEHR